MDRKKTVILPGCNFAGTEVELWDSGGTLKLFQTSQPHCPAFWRLTLGLGPCGHGCSYCYLKGTITARGMAQLPVIFTNSVKRVKLVDRFLAMEGNLLLNVGEASDPLIYDDSFPILPWLIGAFGRQKRHKLLVLTKSDKVYRLLDLSHDGQTVMSWSLNSHEAARYNEPQAPCITSRINAARRCQDAGYPIRVRLDPMIPHDGWRFYYKRLIQQIHMHEIKPERFTVGSLRFYPSVKVRAGDLAQFVMDKRDGDGRYRIDPTLRIEMYRYMFELLHAYFPDVPVGLCKESEEVRNEVGITDDYCNCTW